jgi:AraC-like DNA-binding protein
MTRKIPNHILENQDLYKIEHDDKFIVSKSTILKKGKLHLRNSTHILILLIKGSKVLHLQEEDIMIDTSDILYLSQGNYFMSEIVGDRNNFESVLISFDDDFVLNFIKKYQIKIETDTQLSNIKIKKDIFLDSCISTINEYFSSKMDNKLDLLKLKTQEIFLYTLSKDKAQFLSFLNEILSTKSSRIKYILEANLDIIDNVTDMCKLTRVSNAVLRKEMLRLYNKKPKQWLDEQRLKKAIIMLKNTDKSISEISANCGYSTASWFIIQFKKHHKTTPFLYREENS